MRARESRALPIGYDGYGFQPTSLDQETTRTDGGRTLRSTDRESSEKCQLEDLVRCP